MPKVESYEEKQYLQKEDIYSSISQVFSDLKDEKSGHHGWNLPSSNMEGVTLRLLGDGCLEITYHRIEVGTTETLARLGDDGQKFLQSIVSGLKKKFRKLTGKALNLEKVRTGKDIEKHSRVQSDASWMLGSNRYGYGSRPVGRYLVKDSCVYSFDSDLLE